MSALIQTDDHFDRFGRGFTLALVLHAACAVGLIAYTFLAKLHGPRWGSDQSQVGSIQASMVSAIPLPPKNIPVKDSVLASEHESNVPAPPPKAATQPPPRPTDVLIKGRTPDKALPKHSTLTPPKHPQPTPETRKAATGDVATQFPHSLTPMKNGTATITAEDRVFGLRYAYYIEGIGRLVNQNYNPNAANPAVSQGKSVILLFDIERDGTVQNLRIETRSGSPTLDDAALRAVQQVESFGPLPAGDHITIQYKFDYHQS